ncbi:MAG TPA: DUF4105 domain-containing protein [Mangrovimonas sp.]|nr:DUF4105 domain-containing protein [Mangrovimonas sp.]
MKAKLLILCFLMFSQITLGQLQYLSEQAEISVLTIAPGASLNDAFGHSGFRVKDTTGLDVVFNYGVYDFEAPHFYLKFAQGKLDYLMGANRFTDFYTNYVEENRSIEEQVLNLTQKEKQALYNYLLNNYKPENRRYKYDFFYDNCATRIKDVVLLNVSQPITFNTPEGYTPKTFRSLIQEKLHWNSWGSLGIDIALGAVIDKQATPEEQMFLPEKIARFFEVAKVGKDRALIKSDQVLFQQQESPQTQGFWSPLLVLSILAIAILYITYSDFKKQQRSKWLDATLFGITGGIGIFLLLLWFATDHTATANNYNLLWAFPLNFWVAFLINKNKVKTWITKYLKLLLVMLSLIVVHWISGVQVFAFTLIPLLLALAVRYVFLISQLKNTQ